MEMNNSEETNLSLIGKIEAILFIATSEITLDLLAQVFDLPIPEIELALQHLHQKYTSQTNDSGIWLLWHKDKVQLITNPLAAKYVERFLGLEITSRLSKAALEAIAIIAYRQPITRPQIDDIRGVNSDGVIKSLLSKGLIEEIGRSDTLGRPILYSTTSEFLQAFGLSSLKELPALEKD